MSQKHTSGEQTRQFLGERARVVAASQLNKEKRTKQASRPSTSVNCTCFSFVYEPHLHLRQVVKT